MISQSVEYIWDLLFEEEKINELSLENRFERKNSFKRFTEVEKLNEGAFGVISKVRDKEDGKIYASKCYKKTNKCNLSHLFSVSSSERIEYDILSKFSHPNIVSFHRITIDYEDKFYVVRAIMEKAAMTLNDAMLKTSPSICVRKLWCYQIVSALKLLHDNGFIHCDLKMSNILICEDNNAKLADFGRIFHKCDLYAFREDIMYCQPLLYRSPEIIKSSPISVKMFHIEQTRKKKIMNLYPAVDLSRITNHKKYLVSEFFGLGLLMMDIYTSTFRDINQTHEEILSFIMNDTLRPVNQRKKIINSFIIKKNEIDDVLTTTIAMLIDGNPKTRLKNYDFIYFSDKNKFIEGNVENIRSSKSEISEGTRVQLKEQIKNMTIFASEKKYNLYQLCNSIAYLCRIIPIFYDSIDVKILAACSLIIPLGRALDVFGTNLSDTQSFFGIPNMLDLESNFARIYSKMDGCVRVLSTADFAPNGNVIIKSIRYYIDDIDMTEEDYVKSIAGGQKENDIFSQNKIYKTEYVSNYSIVRKIGKIVDL
jgi:serine/threonine protein kinase